MLLAYIDEIGETGAFVSKDDARYNTSPAFGYAGIILPADRARAFGASFAHEKKTLFRAEIAQATHPGRWERKGASIFRSDTHKRYPEQIRVFNGLVRNLRGQGGHLFYYADEKQIGTPKQTQLDTDRRETAAMRETLNRIARFADAHGSNVMVMIDQINEKARAARLPAMYEHILGRASDYPEMRRIIEPPMHVDSVLSANIQFADWVAACVTRAIDYQLIESSPFAWVAASKAVDAVRGAFTWESKVHLWHRSCPDFNHSDLFKEERPIHPRVDGQLLGSNVDASVMRRIKAAAERARERVHGR